MTLLANAAVTALLLGLLYPAFVSANAARDCLYKTFHNREAETEFTVYSQWGEDGILQHIFQCIGTTGKYYVEFGTEDASSCNTRLLREKHQWTGLLMDGGHSNRSINLRQEMIYAENIVQLFDKYRVPHVGFDQLSIDLDLNTFWVAREVLAAGFRPRSFTFEFNRNFGPTGSYVTVYTPDEMWAMKEGDGRVESCYFGASLQAAVQLFSAYNYTLVAIDTKGVNLFFVDKAVVGGQDVFTYDQVIANTNGTEKFRVLHMPCQNTIWLEVPADVDFKADNWKQQMRPVMLTYKSSKEGIRTFYEPRSPGFSMVMEGSSGSSCRCASSKAMRYGHAGGWQQPASGPNAALMALLYIIIGACIVLAYNILTSKGAASGNGFTRVKSASRV
eukprot:jgi/Chrzof1/10461/UNPLg00388.t1